MGLRSWPVTTVSKHNSSHTPPTPPLTAQWSAASIAQQASIGDPRTRCQSAKSVAHCHCLPLSPPPPAVGGCTGGSLLSVEDNTDALGLGGRSGGATAAFLLTEEVLLTLRPGRSRVTQASNASFTWPW